MRKKPFDRLMHYRRKRFAFRFFWLGSPRNAMLFGFGMILFSISFWGDLMLVMLPGMPIAWLLPFWMGMGLCGIAMWGYGMVMFQVTGYRALARRRRPGASAWREKLKSELLAAMIGFSALLYPLAGFVPALLLWRQRCRIWAFVALAGVVLMSAGLMAWSWSSWITWGILWAGILAVMAAIAAFPDGKKRKLLAWLPLLLLILDVIALQSGYRILRHEAGAERDRLGRMVGHSLRYQDFRERQRSATPVEQIPSLAAMIAEGVQGNWIDDFTMIGEPEAKGKLEAFRRDHAALVAALEEFVQLSPEPLGHTMNAAETTISIKLPELSVFRAAARYLCWSAAQAATDREATLAYQAQLKRLRDWALADFSMLAKLVAVAIESMRLQVLAYPLAAGVLRSDDWRELTAPEVDWPEMFIDSFGDECIRLQESSGIIVQTLSQQKNRLMKWLAQSLRLGGYVMLQRDFLAGVAFLQRQAELARAEGMSGRERMAQGEFPGGRIYFLSMSLGVVGMAQQTMTQIEDNRRMAVIAAAVDAYWRRYGHFPERLELLVPEFLDELPTTALAHEAFGYEHGELTRANGSVFRGFRLRGSDQKQQPWQKKPNFVEFSVPYPH